MPFPSSERAWSAAAAVATASVTEMAAGVDLGAGAVEPKEAVAHQVQEEVEAVEAVRAASLAGEAAAVGRVAAVAAAVEAEARPR